MVSNQEVAVCAPHLYSAKVRTILDNLCVYHKLWMQG